MMSGLVWSVKYFSTNERQVIFKTVRHFNDGFGLTLEGFLRDCLGAIGDEEAWGDPMSTVESALLLASCEMLKNVDEFRIYDLSESVSREAN